MVLCIKEDDTVTKIEMTPRVEFYLMEFLAKSRASTTFLERTASWLWKGDDSTTSSSCCARWVMMRHQFPRRRSSSVVVFRTHLFTCVCMAPFLYTISTFLVSLLSFWAEKTENSWHTSFPGCFSSLEGANVLPQSTTHTQLITHITHD